MFWVSPPQTPLLSRICRQLFRPRFHSHSPHLLPPQLVYPEVFIKHFVFFSSFIGNSHRYHFWLLCCYYGPSVCFHAIGTRTVSCWKVDMGSLICAMTSVHAVHMKGRQGLMSLQVLTQKNWKGAFTLSHPAVKTLVQCTSQTATNLDCKLPPLGPNLSFGLPFSLTLVVYGHQSFSSPCLPQAP